MKPEIIHDATCLIHVEPVGGVTKVMKLADYFAQALPDQHGDSPDAIKREDIRMAMAGEYFDEGTCTTIRRVRS